MAARESLLIDALFVSLDVGTVVLLVVFQDVATGPEEEEGALMWENSL
jgi:hypothetical protein